MLLGRAQTTIERQDLGVLVQGAIGDVAKDGFLRVTDLGFARQEHQSVTLGLFFKLFQGFDDAVDVIGSSGFFIRVGVIVRFTLGWAVANFDGEGSARNLDDRSIVEVTTERFGVDGCRSDDDF